MSGHQYDASKRPFDHMIGYDPKLPHRSRLVWLDQLVQFADDHNFHLTETTLRYKTTCPIDPPAVRYRTTIKLATYSNPSNRPEHPWIGSSSMHNATRDHSLERTSFRLLEKILHNHSHLHHSSALSALITFAKEPQPCFPNSARLLRRIMNTLAATITNSAWTYPPNQPKLSRQILCINGFWCRNLMTIIDGWSTNSHDAEAHAETAAIKYLFPQYKTFWTDILRLPIFYPNDPEHPVLVAGPTTDEALTKALNLYYDTSHDYSTYCGIATYSKDDTPQHMAMAFYNKTGTASVLWFNETVILSPQV